ncbi:MAG: ECF transporter S component [Clostridia bacterium]|nr:ECF transporter S component [Clostridia bacterium]
MRKDAIKRIAINAMGIALFVVLSLCLQVPVFQNYYLCLGYVVMTFYCYSIGITSGTIVGTLGVILYCLLISGLRGMPGWALGNLFLGITLGISFKYIRKIKQPVVEFITSTIIVTAFTAVAMLGIKSFVEFLLYSQPFMLRVATNMTAFIADAFVVIISLPICKFLEPHINKIILQK